MYIYILQITMEGIDVYIYILQITMEGIDVYLCITDYYGGHEE